MKSFLDVYTQVLPIRSRGHFQLVSAVRAGSPCVVALPGQNANHARVEDAFASIADAHGRIAHALIPPVVRRGVHAGMPFLEFACDAVMDGEDMLRLIADKKCTLPYAASDGFIRSLRIALQAAHGARIHLGRISLKNLLFNREGRWFLVGFGRNFVLERDNGELDGETVFFAAQELSNGLPPSPMGDYIALLLFMRSFMTYTETLEPLRAILAGNVKLMDGELFRLLTWLELRVFAAPASLRATMQEAVDAADRVREILGVVPDADAYARVLGGLVRDAETPQPLEGAAGVNAGNEPIVYIGRDLEWIAGPSGERHALGRSLRNIVAALVEEHGRGGRPLSLQALLQIGWPGERPIERAGANRVYVELNRLRKMGLRAVLVRQRDGYRLAPEARIITESRSFFARRR